MAMFLIRRGWIIAAEQDIICVLISFAERKHFQYVRFHFHFVDVQIGFKSGSISEKNPKKRKNVASNTIVVEAVEAVDFYRFRFQHFFTASASTSAFAFIHFMFTFPLPLP